MFVDGYGGVIFIGQTFSALPALCTMVTQCTRPISMLEKAANTASATFSALYVVQVGSNNVLEQAYTDIKEMKGSCLLTIFYQCVGPFCLLSTL